MSKIRMFESNTMLWNDGEIPKCSYCDKDIDEAETLHETPHSGEIVCEDETCRYDLMQNILHDELVELTEEYQCEMCEKEMTETAYEFCDICGDCREGEDEDEDEPKD